MQVWTVVAGKIASIASGNPVSPSTQAMRMSLTPRCFRSLSPCIQNFAPLGLLKPQAADVAIAGHRDSHRDVARPALNRTAIADLEHHAIKQHDGVDVLQWPLLPRAGVVHHRVSHPRDEIAADVDAVELSQVALDIPGRQPAPIEREDLLVKPLSVSRFWIEGR